MSLTPTQQTTLVAHIAANTATIGGVQIGNLEHTADNAEAVAAWYSQAASPDYFVWRTDVPVAEILDQVTWTNYTPNDAPDNTNTFNNRAFTVQIKQQNLGLLFFGRTSFDASKTNLRAALNDATTNLLTGASGASRSGGWTGILPVLRRQAKNVEKVFAVDDGAGVGNTTTDPRGNSTNPDRMAYEGSISGADVREAWGI